MRSACKRGECVSVFIYLSGRRRVCVWRHAICAPSTTTTRWACWGGFNSHTRARKGSMNGGAAARGNLETRIGACRIRVSMEAAFSRMGNSALPLSDAGINKIEHYEINRHTKKQHTRAGAGANRKRMKEMEKKNERELCSEPNKPRACAVYRRDPISGSGNNQKPSARELRSLRSSQTICA